MDSLHTILEFLLAILTLLFGGCNIIQLRNNTALKRKMEAEADHTKYDAQNVIIAGLQSEVQRLQVRVAEDDKRYANLDERYTALLQEVVNLRNKVAELETKK